MGAAAVVGIPDMAIWIYRSRVGVVGVGSAFGSTSSTSTPAGKAWRQVKVAFRQLVYSCFYIVAIGATRLQEVSYTLAKISDVD